MSSPTRATNLAGLTDLLFSVIFGVTFAYKFGILQMDPKAGYGLTPSSAPVPFATFFGFSILSVLLYWRSTRPDSLSLSGWKVTLATLLIIGFTVFESLGPYVALDLALLTGSVALSPNEQSIVKTVFALQVVSVAVAILLKRKLFKS